MGCGAAGAGEGGPWLGPQVAEGGREARIAQGLLAGVAGGNAVEDQGRAPGWGPERCRVERERVS